MGCVIVKSGRIVSSGYNSVGCHNSSSYRKCNNSIHAEQAAIGKLVGNPDLLFGAYLYISRISRRGNLLLARPCPFCMRLIKAVGIKKVFYSDSNGSITMEKVSYD